MGGFGTLLTSPHKPDDYSLMQLSLRRLMEEVAPRVREPERRPEDQVSILMRSLVVESNVDKDFRLMGHLCKGKEVRIDLLGSVVKTV